MILNSFTRYFNWSASNSLYKNTTDTLLNGTIRHRHFRNSILANQVLIMDTPVYMVPTLHFMAPHKDGNIAYDFKYLYLCIKKNVLIWLLQLKAFRY